MVIKLLVKVLSTQAAKELVVYVVDQIAKRTDNKIDDTATRAVAKILGVIPPV